MPRKIRPIRIEGNIAYVPLTRGYEAIIDAADVHLVADWNWCAWVKGRQTYAVRGTKLSGKQLQVRMHRQILNPPSGLMIDHVSGDGLDCRRSNMRIATAGQNMKNQRAHRDNSSGVKGVSWDKARQKWRASITTDRKTLFLGRYDDMGAAYQAYRCACKKMHGAFSRPQ
jgi:hypothetical protein